MVPFDIWLGFLKNRQFHPELIARRLAGFLL
jgi:hypothetical protein